MKTGYYWAMLLMAQLAGHSAPPPVQLLWDKGYGGDWRPLAPKPDVLRVVVPLPDGGLLLGGDSGSVRNDSKTAPFHGVWDIWLVRLDADGNKVWDQSYGGTNDDRLSKVLALPDGGFLLAGESSSCASGTKTSCAKGVGTDWWLVRIDGAGRQLWEQSYWITDYDDRLTALLALPDGGFLLGGWDTGLLGNEWPPLTKTPVDYWLVWVDAAGEELRRARYGGLWSDQLVDIVPTAHGGFLLCGNSLSGVGGNKTSAHCGDAGFDVWLVRVDGQGQKLWEQDLRRSSNPTSDDFYVKAVALGDGGFAVGVRGYSLREGPLRSAALAPGQAIEVSSVGGCSSTVGWGGDDYWLVRLDAQGAVLWDRAYGGDGNDSLNDLAPTADGGFCLIGGSNSGVSGNKTCPLNGDVAKGNGDTWMVRVNALGGLVWDRCLSLGRADEPRRLCVGLQQQVFLLGTTIGETAGSDQVSPWVVAVGPEGNQLWEFALPFEGMDLEALYLLGRTADGGFYAGGSGTYSAGAAGKYRVLKIGPPAIPAAQDSARLLPLRDLQGDLHQDGFLFSLVGVQNTSYATEYSTNLRDWTPFATNHVGSVDVKVRDLGATNAPERYYRARKQSP